MKQAKKCWQQSLEGIPKMLLLYAQGHKESELANCVRHCHTLHSCTVLSATKYVTSRLGPPEATSPTSSNCFEFQSGVKCKRSHELMSKFAFAQC